MLDRVLFAGGGTGGHVYMGVALADELKKRRPETEVLFVGAPQGVEQRILPGLGWPLRTIDVGGLKKVGVARAARTFLQLPRSFWQARRIVREFAPCAVVGVGGYSSGPVVLAGKLLGVPALLIEPNLQPGFANRLLAGWADAAAVAFEETARWFGEKARLTGIPIRREFYQVTTEIATEGPLRILVFGGSQGSHAINNLMCQALHFLVPGRLSIVHQTGTADLEWVKESYRGAGFEAEITAFIEDMPARFSRTDLVISRAGASTIAEITAAGRPALLIPFPAAADDHQRKNAGALAEKRAALVLEQQGATGKALAGQIAALEQDRERLRQMSQAGRLLARPDSVAKILDLLEQMQSRHRQGAGTP